MSFLLTVHVKLCENMYMNKKVYFCIGEKGKHREPTNRNRHLWIMYRYLILQTTVMYIYGLLRTWDKPPGDITVHNEICHFLLQSDHWSLMRQLINKSDDFGRINNIIGYCSTDTTKNMCSPFIWRMVALFSNEDVSFISGADSAHFLWSATLMLVMNVSECQ